jgi:hypothetical protein
MQAIFSQLSGLVGLFVFLARVWKLAPVEGAVVAGVGVALAVYLILILGDIAIRTIIRQNTPGTRDTVAPGQHQKHASSPRPSDERSRSEEHALAGAAA